MTIYFASSEDIDFELFSGAVVSTTADRFDADYARCSIKTNVAIDYFSCDIDTPLTTIYLSCQWWCSGNSSAVADNEAIVFSDGTTDVFKLQPANGVWKIYSYDAGWQLRATLSSAPTNSALIKITIKFVLAVSGSIEVWYDEVSQGSWAGDTIGDTGVSGVDTFEFRNIFSGALDVYVSEVVIADEQTINMRVATLVPNANGTNTAWVNDYTAVDEVVDSDADTLQSDTADQVETMGLTNYGGSTDLIVAAVFVSAKAIRGASGPQNLQLAVREGATEGFGANKALSLVYAVYRDIWETNPDTAAAWTLSELDTLEAGVKSIT